MAKKVVAFVLMVVMVILSVSGASAFTAYSNSYFTWGANSTMNLGPYNFGDGQTILFEATAYSTLNGTFQVELQKEVLPLIWTTVGYVYTLNCSSGSSYNARTGATVQGYWNRVYWAMTGTGTYRIVLKNPSNINSMIIFSESYWYSY